MDAAFNASLVIQNIFSFFQDCEIAQNQRMAKSPHRDAGEHISARNEDQTVRRHVAQGPVILQCQCRLAGSSVARDRRLCGQLIRDIEVQRLRIKHVDNHIP